MSHPDDQERDLPPPHDTPIDPEFRLAEDPQFLKLVASVEEAYDRYVNALGAAINNVEGKPKLEKEIGELENPQYEERLRAAAKQYQATDLPAALQRMREINIATHIYGIKDWHAVLSAIYVWHENFEGAEVAALFKKTEAVNDKIFRNLSELSDAMRKSDALSIAELNALPKGSPITPFTPKEWGLLATALQRILDQQTQTAEQKIADKDARLTECRAQIETLDLQKPQLLEQAENAGGELAPSVESISRQMNEEHGRVKTVDHTTLVNPRSHYWEDFRDWKKGIFLRALEKLRGIDFDKGMHRSLENELGWASNNNHFDVFFVDGAGRQISTTHIHNVLEIMLFLVLANEHFDVEIFKGELRGIEYYRAEGRSADFVIPRNGVLEAGILV
jgi:hypothetical protein